MHTPSKSNEPAFLKESGVSVKGRRRFLGAGSAMAPVILTMINQPALGATCFTPSRSLSKNISHSQKDFIGNCSNPQSPGNYKAQYDPANPNGGSFSWPIHPTTPFHPTFSGSTYWLSKGTQIVRGGGSNAVTTVVSEINGRSMTMWEVLDLGGNSSYGDKTDSGQIAFHLVGAYLNCLGGGGASIDPKAMTVAGVLTIWDEYRTKGYYEVTAGVRWYPAQIIDYLKENSIVL